MKDPLIQTYTLPYVKFISKNISKRSKIYLLTFEQESAALTNKEFEEQCNELKKYNIIPIRFSYSNFGLKMILKVMFLFCKMTLFILKNNISIIHAWCTPGGSIGYILSVITRKPLVLDSFEPHAEPMLESNTWAKKSIAFKLLFWLEKAQLKRAKKVITCVKSMNIYTQEKYNFTLENYHTKPACINFNHFNIDKRKDSTLLKNLKLENKIIGVYSGKFGGNYLIDEVFLIIKNSLDYFGKEHFKFIILNNDSDEFIRSFLKKYNIPESIIIKKYISHDEVPLYLGLADFGVTPFTPVPSKRYGTPIKTGEYWSLGLPIIITKGISDDSEIITNENIGYVLQDLSLIEIRKSIDKIASLIKEKDINEKIFLIAKKYRNMQIAEKVYDDIYGTLN